MKVISEQGSPEYYELRAIEEIHAARSIRNHIGQDPSGGDAYRKMGYHKHMIKAIQLLILAWLNCGTTEE
ncbi:hypothetical protein LCGC14_0811520 [marine sediment metagenome]|uniref:Uncharacterized protein n=1 Tax=marine sediment metagenome TaxID=412755 RepID=A0A0F9PLK3_9ZZZZ